MTRRLVAVGLVAAALVVPLDASTRYDRRLRFSTISTPRFDIHFHQGEEPLARRLAAIAEEVADRLARDLGRPSGRVHVILVNQTDLSNGWATPTPYNLIEINTVPPPGESSIGNTDDWLRLVFTHEYTHIVHLETSRGWIGGLRHVFGRHPVLFPNLFLPLWQIEGLATYGESALTGGGRVRAGDFRMMLDEAARGRRADPIDRASVDLVDWPSGHAPYLYGGYFHQYLSDRFGPESLSRLSRETAGRLPYFGATAFRKVFDRPLGELWSDFEEDARSRAHPIENRSTRLTHHGFSVNAPRFADDGRLYYSVVNPHGFPSLMELTPEGPRRVTTKYLGGRIATSGRSIVFDQLDLIRDVALQSDLYVADANGKVRALTRGARAADPDVSPDGRTIACTVQLTDRRDLSTLAFSPSGPPDQPQTLLSEPMTEFTSPRWSPDGRTIAVERRHLDGPSEIVLVDVVTRSVRTIARLTTGRAVSPVWQRDGSAVLFAAARGSDAFAIYSASLATGAHKRLGGTGPGARSPAISPDGRTIVFVGYTVEGYDLFSMPLDGAAWTDVEPEAGPPSPPPPPPSATTAAVQQYRPLRSLAPSFWTPTLDSEGGEIRAGASTFATDPLGRHAYVANVAWPAARARPDWQIGYAYDRWWPTLFADLSDDVDPWRDGTVRRLEAEAGALFPVQRVRWSSSVMTAFRGSSERFECSACVPGVNALVRRRAVRLGFNLDGSKQYGYSISREEGAAVTLTSDLDREALGADGDGTAVTLSGRVYQRAFARHAVLAARVAGAASWGDPVMRRQFQASGAGPVPPAFAFGSDAIGLMRGYENSAISGPRAFTANVDYRFPITFVQRGIGTLPFFLQSIHGAAFADFGHAWTGDFDASEVRQSFGLELSVDTVVGYWLPLTLTGGIALRDDPVAGRRDVVGFARIGKAF